ncbi:Transthyretin-like protein [Dirofilaria immitis]
MKHEILLILLLLLSTIAAFRSLKIGRKQSTAVKGVLMCNGKPAANVKVKLYNYSRDRYRKSSMDEGRTDSEGRFLLKGREISITGIDPMLKLYHDCDVENTQCLKEFSILIPNDFVSEDLEPKKTFDTGTLNLAGKIFDEGQECVN